MANFFIRIELHGAEPSHYEALRKAMATKLSASTNVVGIDEVTYQLPAATYRIIDSVLDASDLCSEVMSVALSIVPRSAKEPWVLVMESDLISFILDEAPPEKRKFLRF